VAIRVLLVDDVVAVRRLVRTALRFRGGFEVVGEAGDGVEAVRQADELRPDVVVLDLGLPGLAGREVLSRIRDGSPSSKIVVFSGADPDDDDSGTDIRRELSKDDELDYLVDLLTSLGQDPGEQETIRLPQALPSAREARRFATRVVSRWQFDSLLDDVLLVVSELAANAITHADSALELRLSHAGNVLRIEVADNGSGTPEPQPESMSEEHGRGLHLVARLTAAWGMEELADGGKVVWAEMARTDGPSGGGQTRPSAPSAPGAPSA